MEIRRSKRSNRFFYLRNAITRSSVASQKKAQLTMYLYRFLFNIARFCFFYLNYFITRRLTANVILFFSILFSLLFSISLQKITFLLVIFAIPFVLYSAITRFLSLRYPTFVLWEKEHTRITFAQMSEFWGLLITCFILAFAKALLLAFCNIQELLSVVSQLHARMDAVHLTALKAMETLEKGDLNALTSYLIAMKNLSNYCGTCKDLTVCNSLKEFFERNSLIGVAHVAGNRDAEVIPEGSQRAICAKLLSLYEKSMSGNNADQTKQLTELINKVCIEKETPRQPWIQIIGPIFSSTTDKTR